MRNINKCKAKYIFDKWCLKVYLSILHGQATMRIGLDAAHHFFAPLFLNKYHLIGFHIAVGMVEW